MDLKDVKIPYEILIRFGLDGLPAGAHCQYLRRVTLDGEVLKEEIGQAEPLDIAGFPTSDIMSNTTRDALARVTSLESEKAVLVKELETAGDRVAELTAEKEALALQLRELQAQIAGLNDRAAAAATEKQIVDAQLAAANQERDGLADQVRELKQQVEAGAE
ncbi:hypothetical protein [Neorhizobium sp. IRS_2294]|uniref:hypothetical protein n=1 Tax=unclassified Neorhizobium TaxID=2629175 RepID=UPI003D284D43